MEEFLGKHKFAKLYTVQEKVKYKLISLKIFKLAKYILPPEVPGPGDLVSKFSQTLRV